MTHGSVRVARTEKVLIGRITATHGARVHLAFSGRTPCGSARSSRITLPATTYRGIDLQLLCRRCFTPENLTRAQSEVTNGGRFNAALDDFLCTVRKVVGYAPEPAVAVPARTASPVRAAAGGATAPALRPALAKLIARNQERAKSRPLGAWGQLAETFAKTHTIARIAA